MFDVVAQRAVGDGHAKLTVARGGERFAAIAFRTAVPMPPRIHALFRPEVNHWNELQSLELVIDYWTAARHERRADSNNRPSRRHRGPTGRALPDAAKHHPHCCRRTA